MLARPRGVQNQHTWSRSVSIGRPEKDPRLQGLQPEVALVRAVCSEEQGLLDWWRGWGRGHESSQPPLLYGVLSWVSLRTVLSGSFTVNIQNLPTGYQWGTCWLLLRMLCGGPRMLFFEQNMLDVMAFCTTETTGICFPWFIRIMPVVFCGVLF